MLDPRSSDGKWTSLLTFWDWYCDKWSVAWKSFPSLRMYSVCHGDCPGLALLPELQKQEFSLWWPEEGLDHLDHFLTLATKRWVGLGACFMFTGIWKANHILGIPRGKLSYFSQLRWEEKACCNFLFCGLKSSSLQMIASQVNRSHFKGQPHLSGRGCLRAGRMPGLP